MNLSDIEDAVMFVSMGMYDDHSAMLNKSTGEILYSSESGDLHEIPEDAYESEDWIEIPRRVSELKAH